MARTNEVLKGTKNGPSFSTSHPSVRFAFSNSMTPPAFQRPPVVPFQFCEVDGPTPPRPVDAPAPPKALPSTSKGRQLVSPRTCLTSATCSVNASRVPTCTKSDSSQSQTVRPEFHWHVWRRPHCRDNTFLIPAVDTGEQ